MLEYTYGYERLFGGLSKSWFKDIKKVGQTE